LSALKTRSLPLPIVRRCITRSAARIS